MKAKPLIAGALILLGTNVFVYATTRQWTTEHVLTAAKARLDAALRDAGLHDQVYSVEDTNKGAIALAIPLAGGRYYWWNDAVPFWSLGVLLTGSGLAVIGYRPKSKVPAAG